LTTGFSNGPSEQDVEFYERELADFIPDRVFDAHAHLTHPRLSTPTGPDLPDPVGYEEYRHYMDWLLPGRDVAAMFLAFSRQPEGATAANAWTATQVARDPRCRGLLFVRPDDDPEWVRQEVRRLGLHGLKPYHTCAPTRPTWEAELPAYLPETLVRVAHEENWVITLHLVKSRAVADPGNLHWIRHYCTKYPQMRLILAHSARGFQPAHNLEGLPQLVGLENLYFDSSANCEPIAHQAILRLFGPERLLYGSDGLLVSHLRGRSVAAADSFLWLYEDTPVWEEKHAAIRPVLVGLEHLRSMKWACWAEKLSGRQIEDLFWNNAVRLLGVS